eukprot:CAMPEP_0196591540 /NCGR_PEP_ID=MMETSP1081-20130531/70003_1 /TAXON_ID=36882 /ORGANISM="Pyramimonas amylifera, Strain CCMP720" /LENGTH=136 /DNA_ID=CAMNT_0041914927 /DNA_START=156 /DNA_END=566 /DNA_ORIENTATION=+
MYILCKGKAGIIGLKGWVVKELHAGAYFGEIALFFGVRRTATITAVSFCDVFKLSQDAFQAVMDQYPDNQELIQNQAEDMFNESVLCFKCGEMGHISSQCFLKDETILDHGPSSNNPDQRYANVAKEQRPKKDAKI